MTHSATVKSLRAIALEAATFQRDGFSADWMKSGWDAVRHPQAPGVRWRLRVGANGALIVPALGTPGSWILSSTSRPSPRRFADLCRAMDAALAEIGSAEPRAAP